MVYFKDNSSPSGERHLVILDDQHQPVEKGTILVVYAPLVGGRNVSPWPRLTNSFYLDEWSQEVSLNKNVKVMQSGIAISNLPEIFITPKDIGSGLKMCLAVVEGDYASSVHMTPSTLHCLLMSIIPISLRHFVKRGVHLQILCLHLWRAVHLWDLHDLAGLPITGCLYDEVVPSALERTGADEKGGRFIPCSSKYLLYAYHLLQGADDDQCSNVSIEKRVKFWSKKAIKYHLPPPRKEKKTVRPKSTHNPFGDIITHKRWSIAEEALFEKLCIEDNLKEEVYLAAYLAYWLCTFVLPGKDVNSIRPSTFKMASMMANGRRVSLAIPVLASIYEGLNIIASSSRPARTSSSFPVHFVYAWLASYFKTYYPIWQGLRGPKMTRFFGEGGAKYYDPQEARKRIHKAKFVFWACNMIVKNRPFKFIDNGDAEELDHG
ncbi:UNVERIFIED_CONTAM: hypothetical protein Slati_2968900 [Sesamum latifolium]|uniref:Aminotransferase-like plant mobile domain-containing protein n=1 Tax=Sesamum latifolium TaxID=2727402 RepID=A0AAW2VFA1_9LAMI